MRADTKAEGADVLDAMFDALSHRKRREIIRAAEHGTSRHALWQDTTCTRSELYHVHLPKLTDIDVLELNSQAVETSENYALARVIMRASTRAIEQ